ncbi:hypothetical protein L6164_004136 [Bauhinia variegata]|uniref:Uncharacterized protein n=1 Tax=Bauhinia variegata TaxID=167791 RepID=A0ACB9Q8X6_BAUVA|nr:hypothetical protein L6164_004136 [Bauhinia variegata]
MKAWFKALVVLALTLSLLLSTWCTRAEAVARPYTEGQSFPSGEISSSQAPKDLQAHRKNPSKQVASCFRRIPPSSSNPTQNK